MTQEIKQLLADAQVQSVKLQSPYTRPDEDQHPVHKGELEKLLGIVKALEQKFLALFEGASAEEEQRTEKADPVSLSTSVSSSLSTAASDPVSLSTSVSSSLPSSAEETGSLSTSVSTGAPKADPAA